MNKYNGFEMVARGTISSILCIINVKCTCKIMCRNVYILRHKHTSLIHGKDQHNIYFIHLTMILI